MKNKKGFALIISLALVIAVVLPGTLALSTDQAATCLLYTSPSPRDRQKSRMPSSA